MSALLQKAPENTIHYTMQNNVEIIQINISGEDKPGMTSSLTEILARYDAFILDIGQANIHQSLTLGILIKTTADKSGSIMKELLFKASGTGRDDPFHAHLRGTLQRLGGPSGQKPLHHHPAGPHRHGTPHRRGDEGRGRARAEHRRHQTPHGPHAPLRGRPRRQVVHRTPRCADRSPTRNAARCRRDL